MGGAGVGVIEAYVYMSVRTRKSSLVSRRNALVRTHLIDLKVVANTPSSDWI